MSGLSELIAIVFPLSALILYYVLYRSRLIPRWISGWGLLALIPYCAAAFLALFDVIEPAGGSGDALKMPWACKEMVMALWLIAKVQPICSFQVGQNRGVMTVCLFFHDARSIIMRMCRLPWSEGFRRWRCARE